MNTKIKRIEIKNFKLIKNTTLEFTDSGIISLAGGNEVGKSCIVNAIRRLMYNNNISRLKQEISFGETQCSIKMTFDDGATIERIINKATGANGYTFIDGTGAQIVKVDRLTGGGYNEIPVEINKYFNVAYNEDTGWELNVRSSKDPLLFATTSPVDNDKLINKCGIADNLVNGITYGADKLKEFEGEHRKLQEAQKLTLEQLDGLVVYDVTPVEPIVNTVEAQVEALKSVLSTCNKVNQLRQLLSESSKYECLAELQPVSINNGVKQLNDCLNLIREMQRESERLNSYKELNKELLIDTESQVTLERYARCLSMIADLARIESDLEQFDKVDTLKPVTDELTAYNKSKSILDCLSAIQSKTNEIEGLDTEIGELRQKIDELEESRVRIEGDTLVIKCDDCGHENKVSTARISALIGGGI